MIATTPQPPYYAVIFTSLRTADDEGYGEMTALMERLAADRPGYLGLESAREEVGITVSYWRDLEAIDGWRRDVRHAAAQRLGRDRWYEAYRVRVARDHGFDAGAPVEDV